MSIRLIACLDIDGDRVVKGQDLHEAGDPVDLAKFFTAEGADELGLMDVTASSEAGLTIVEVVRRVRQDVEIPLLVGGGIRGIEDMREVLSSGASKAIINRAAVKDPELIREAAAEFGGERVVVAIDARRKTTIRQAEEPHAQMPVALVEGLTRGETMLGLEGLGGFTGSEEEPVYQMVPAPEDEPAWEVFTHSGRVPTGLDAIEWARRVESLGAGEILLASLDGYDHDLLVAVTGDVSIPVVADVGAGRPEHIIAAAREGRAAGVLLASILHDGVYRISDLKRLADAE
jgi:imidazole glycerol-phosphate synthase subunit HisF